jgi:hypothetical protein
MIHIFHNNKAPLNPLVRDPRCRASPVFNSFIGNLPHVLDHNFLMAKKIIAIIVPVLQYSPAVHKVQDLRQPTYSLWMLQPTIRKAWLTSTLTILYKVASLSKILIINILHIVRKYLNIAICHSFNINFPVMATVFDIKKLKYFLQKVLIDCALVYIRSMEKLLNVFI